MALLLLLLQGRMEIPNMQMRWRVVTYTTAERVRQVVMTPSMDRQISFIRRHKLVVVHAAMRGHDTSRGTQGTHVVQDTSAMGRQDHRRCLTTTQDLQAVQIVQAVVRQIGSSIGSIPIAHEG